jgi:hypothetical protein
VRLVTTTARSSSKNFFAAHQKARRIGRRLYRATPHSTRLFGIRHGQVRFIAVADRRLLRAGRRPALRRYLSYAGVGWQRPRTQKR